MSFGAGVGHKYKTLGNETDSSDVEYISEDERLPRGREHSGLINDGGHYRYQQSPKPNEREGFSLDIVTRIVIDKLRDKNFIFMVLLLLFVIGFGTANRVIYKIQLTPMGRYAIFISWVITISYCFLYFGIFAVRRYGLFVITSEMVAYVFSRRGIKIIVLGLMDALGFVLGIFAARKLTGFLLTLLPQVIIPMTMIISLVALKARYHWGQVIGAGFLVGGVIISLIPVLTHSGTGEGGWRVILWAGLYLLSIVPNSVSFILKEKVFLEMPSMDIFVVNSFGSLWQLVFSVLLFPLVLVPGFSPVTFSTIGDYIPNGAQCLIGFTPTTADDCDGEPWLMMMYVAVNLSWNISLLLLLKRGGAVFTFIGAAVSLPLSHLAFAINWPIYGGEKLQWLDILGLVIVLAGLIVYRYFALLQKKKMDAQKPEASPVVVHEEEEQKILDEADLQRKKF